MVSIMRSKGGRKREHKKGEVEGEQKRK